MKLRTSPWTEPAPAGRLGRLARRGHVPDHDAMQLDGLVLGPAHKVTQIGQVGYTALKIKTLN